MASLQLTFFQKDERIGSETIYDALSRPEQQIRAVEMARIKYPQADKVTGLYSRLSGLPFFTIENPVPAVRTRVAIRRPSPYINGSSSARIPDGMRGTSPTGTPSTSTARASTVRRPKT